MVHDAASWHTLTLRQSASKMQETDIVGNPNVVDAARGKVASRHERVKYYCTVVIDSSHRVIASVLQNDLPASRMTQVQHEQRATDDSSASLFAPTTSSSAVQATAIGSAPAMHSPCGMKLSMRVWEASKQSCVCCYQGLHRVTLHNCEKQKGKQSRAQCACRKPSNLTTYAVCLNPATR